jgi:hypothetical protein
LQAQFHRLKARRGPKKAIMAVVASILTAIILKDGTMYHDLHDMQHGWPARDDVPDYAPYESKEALHRGMLLVFKRLLLVRSTFVNTPAKPGSSEEVEARRALSRLLGALAGNMVDSEGALFRSPCGAATWALAAWAATGIAELTDPDNKNREYELVLQRRPGKKASFDEKCRGQLPRVRGRNCSAWARRREGDPVADRPHGAVL